MLNLAKASDHCVVVNPDLCVVAKALRRASRLRHNTLCYSLCPLIVGCGTATRQYSEALKLTKLHKAIPSAKAVSEAVTDCKGFGS